MSQDNDCKGKEAWSVLLDRLHRTRTSKGRQESGMYSVEGFRLVERAIQYGAPLKEVLVATSLREKEQPRWLALEQRLGEVGCPVRVAPDEALESFTEGRTFGSVMGLVALPGEVSLERWSDLSRPCKWLVLVDVMDPGNLGALMRTSLASGVQAMICVKGTDPTHPKAVRTSMGAIYSLPIARFSSLEPLMELLKSYQIQRVGAVVGRGVAPHEGVLSSRHALFAGSEAHGLPPECEAQLDLSWSIPMVETVDSFSVNAATAILLYESNRRSWAQGV